MKSAFSLRIAVSYALLSSLIAGDHASAAEKPNILFLITDQQTAGALSCAGNPYVKTPNLDRLAARGVRFEKSYCTYPLCCPSRGSLFSSRMAHELGIYGNFDAELSEKDVPTMGDLFRAAGYETAYAGKWHLQAPFPAFKNGKIPGFEVLPLSGKDPHTLDLEKEGKGLTVDPNAADAAIRFLKQPHERPFLLVASILNPHDICEFPECEALRKLVPSDSAKLPPARSNLELSQPLPSVLDARPAGGSKHPDWNERQWQEYFCAYCRLVEMADAEVGRVLKGLDDAGLASSTVVVFTSDHGEMMGS
ncbi:MAG: sulfatase, partial [Planctomycetota bacterium]